MGATYTRRPNGTYLITVHNARQRERKVIKGTEKDAKQLVQYILRQEMAGVNVVDALRAAHTAPSASPTREWPTLRAAVPEFIRDMEARGEWQGSTPINYRRRLTGYVYDFLLPDGRALGDLPIDQVTEQMIGAVLDRARTAGADGRKAKSLATQDQIRSPLRRFFREMIRKHGLPGPNPCDDLKDYMSKAPSKRARHGKIAYFTQAEGPTLFAACEAAYPRWLAFIGCCTLAGLRWGEAAALERDDIDFKAAVIHVQRTISDKTGHVKACKDGEDRFVPLSPRLGAWLRRHLEAVALDGQVAEWGPEARALVFPNSRGHIGRHSTFMEHAWQPLLKAAGLRYRKPHAMRHSFATWALEGSEEKGIAPAPILAVRDWMGHASVQETEGYLHRSKASHSKAVANLDAYVVA
jgi:integrase